MRRYNASHDSRMSVNHANHRSNNGCQTYALRSGFHKINFEVKKL